MSRFAYLAALTALATTAYASVGPVTDFHIQSAIVNPDGSIQRGAVTAEGGAMGPLIVGNKGDNFKINVVNELTNSSMLLTTTIHWHGLFQAGSNWADGPSFVNQCPIASGNSFLYDFTVPDQAGTFWYHSHHATQYCDGLRGPLVVYDPADPYASEYDVDDESTVITLSDWYHTVAPTIESTVVFGTSDATLINGKGRFFDGTSVNTAELAVITVDAGKRYRFRLVSVSCDPNFTFQIDGHTMTIIEVDGVNHQKLAVDQLQIFAGQRYSVVVTADQAVDNYWIRADPNNGNTGTDLGLNSAILRYTGAAAVEPTTVASSTNPLVNSKLVPLENPGVVGAKCLDCADYNLNLDFAFTGTFQVNGASYVPPTTPVLLQILSGASSAADLLPAGSLYALPKNSSIQLSMPGGALAGAPHPFHLHGHTFDVVRGPGETTYNFDTPVRRDVVSLGNDAVDGITNNVTVRFFTDNEGPWFLHCHIDWHLEAGLAVVFVEDFDEVSSKVAPTTEWENLCPTYDALTADQIGGN